MLVSNFSVTLSLEAKLHLLHSYMNVKWITLPCDTQVKRRGVFSLVISASLLQGGGSEVVVCPALLHVRLSVLPLEKAAGAAPSG